ncbi:MAG TPA: DUF4142 domain-containing protein [Caldimonas sp.]|nr:DUF4142 domain-containing protein [Caldimonas sp.]
MQRSDPFRLCKEIAVAGALVSGLAPAIAADEDFVQKAAAGGVAEVAAGQMAGQKGASESVKSFGARMVEDHGKANDELKSIATSKKMGMPAAPDASQQKAAAALEAKSGADFDRAFKQQMIADHKSAIALFQKEAKSGSDPDLKSFAGKTLPTLQEHLKMAEAMK